MLKIRLTRKGRRNDPSFRLVVSEHTNPVKGKFLEELGHYNPKLKTKIFKKERILDWIGKGAQCSGTVHNLLVDEGIVQGPKIKAWRPKKRKSEEKKEEAAAGEPSDKPQEPAKPVEKKEAEEEKTESKPKEKKEQAKEPAQPEKQKQEEETKPEEKTEQKSEEKKEVEEPKKQEIKE